MVHFMVDEQIWPLPIKQWSLALLYPRATYQTRHCLQLNLRIELGERNPDKNLWTQQSACKRRRAGNRLFPAIPHHSRSAFSTLTHSRKKSRKDWRSITSFAYLYCCLVLLPVGFVRAGSYWRYDAIRPHCTAAESQLTGGQGKRAHYSSRGLINRARNSNMMECFWCRGLLNKLLALQKSKKALDYK